MNEQNCSGRQKQKQNKKCLKHYNYTLLIKHTHTHTHPFDCNENWVLILVRMEVVWEEIAFQFCFKGDRVEQCLSLVGVNSKCGVQSNNSNNNNTLFHKDKDLNTISFFTDLSWWQTQQHSIQQTRIQIIVAN